MRSISVILLALLSSQLVAQTTREYRLMSEMDGIHILDDGGEGLELPMWGFAWDTAANPENYNLTLPGPTIYANEGDSVIVWLRNPSMEGHTIHLHGLDVPQEHDGVPHTSDFVLTGEERAYRFLATHAGNFIYHCHVVTTMHLALGMYGSVIIHPADSSNRAYTNGPTYDTQYEYLLSDLDSRWSKDFTSIGDFKSYAPDYLLINGKNRYFIYRDSGMVVHGAQGDRALLRFMNVGYRVHKLKFPATLSAEVLMSDGRVLDQSFIADSLLVYPGERYSIMAEFLSEDTSAIELEMLDPYRLEHISFEYIPVNHDSFTFDVPTDSIDGIAGHRVPALKIFPNPVKDELWIENTAGPSYTTIEIFSMEGALAKRVEMKRSQLMNRVSTADLAPGSYFTVLSNGKDVRVGKFIKASP